MVSLRMVSGILPCAEQAQLPESRHWISMSTAWLFNFNTHSYEPILLFLRSIDLFLWNGQVEGEPDHSTTWFSPVR